MLYRTSSVLLGCLLAGLVVFWAGCSLDVPEEETLLYQVKARGVLIAGVKFDARPFAYLDTDGTVKGFEVDLVREIARRISPDIEVEFHQVMPSTRMVGLSLGQWDLVAATMTITPEREELIDFSDVYFTARQAVLVPQKSRYGKVSQLSDATILYVINTTNERNIKKALPNATFKGYPSANDAFYALADGKGNAMTSDDSILYGLMAQSCQYRLLPQRLSQEPYGFGIRQDNEGKSTESFRLAVNRAIEAMMVDGTMNKLRRKWLQPYETMSMCG